MNHSHHSSRIFVASVSAVLLILLALLATQPTTQTLKAWSPTPTPPPSDVVEPSTDRSRVMKMIAADFQPALLLAPAAATPCIAGFAGGYPCNNVDLKAFLPLASIGGGNGNDIWGWTGCGGREFALMGRTSGTSFVEISDPENPVYLGNLPRQTANSSWRDIKTYADHAFIVSEASNHGMQIFDLTQLCNVINPPITFSNTERYTGFGNAHNIVINEATGFAYAVGTNTCSGGLHMVDISTPTSPTNAGCFSSDGYTHDAQCVLYTGPDAEHYGKEICFNANEDTVTIVDVTTKSSPNELSRTGYSGQEYTHQNWLSPNQTLLYLNDELDESRNGHNTRTRIWDVSDLDSPTVIGVYNGATPAIDHNLYTKGDLLFEANYRAGLQILDGADAANGNLSQVAYFDIYPNSNSANFNGAWSNFPYFDSGIVVVSGIEEGLFVLDPTICTASDESETVLIQGDSGTNSAEIRWHRTGSATHEIWDITNDPYFTPGASCAGSADCTTTTGSTHSAAGALANPAENHTYLIVTRNSCGSPAENLSNRTGTFTFAITPGV